MTSKNPSKHTSTKKAILIFLEENYGEWTPKVIARKINRNYNTVRGVCYALYKNKTLERTRVGLCAFYRLRRPYENEFYRISRVSTGILPEIHNLHLYRGGLIHQKGGYRPEVYNKDFRYIFGHKRNVTVRHGKKNQSINLWLSCSENPLTFEDFKHFLTFVEGLTHVKVWSELSKWTIKRYGINVDNQKFEETPQPTLLLSAFAGWFAQQYDKEIDGVKLRRTEIESRNAITADEFMNLVRGGITTNQALNAVAVLARKLDTLQREFRSYLKYQERKERKHEIICSECGSVQIRGQTFCSICGTPLKKKKSKGDDKQK